MSIEGRGDCLLVLLNDILKVTVPLQLTDRNTKLNSDWMPFCARSGEDPQVDVSLHLVLNSQ